MKQLKVGIIGLGEVAQIIHLPILEMLNKKFKIAALCDISVNVLAVIGEIYRVPEANRYTDYRSLVRQSDLDAVFVLNSSEFHKDCTSAALREGKHVFVEKPMCMTKQDAEAIIQEKNERGLQVMVGYMRRFAPAYRLALEEVSKLEKINYVHVRDIIGGGKLFVDHNSDIYRPNDIPVHMSGERSAKNDAQLLEALGSDASTEACNLYGMLHGFYCHDLSAMREMFGMPKSVISCVVRGDFCHIMFDYGSFIVNYEVGTDRQRRFDAYIEVFGPEKTIKVQYDTNNIRQLPTILHIKDTVGESFSERTIRPTYKDAYVAEIEHWYDVITQGLNPITTAEDFLQDLELFQMIIPQLETVRQ
ncbi:Gfo/Idh/MocA family oxidoreductase [Paenibacillus sp. HWE-109]|uniref:Gfo/Idh/MocA family oxidoreductase n=1 Tax=Paenibacillus sp. HWE-109 TaxID=1306526 RepID=UPI001EE11719|nr:Gfo/Idh/MocA family oxidoreductase [Paenibacillus sp. HWE-109]UKS28544.1 Gfo/Idh/MocA family oxidoreductase [Paenibacillus sp. HWE-109]